MNIPGRKSTTHGLHPLVASMGLASILDEQPAPTGIIDSDGSVVYRNKAATAAIGGLVGKHGQRIVAPMQAAIRAAARRARTFPYLEIVKVDVEDVHIELETTFTTLPGGFLINYRDVTAEQERIRALVETADDLAATSRSFEELTARLSGDAASVASRADTVSSGATELSASIQSISTSATTAVNDTASAVGTAGGANERISKLIESSSQIETVSRMINEIAEQTNLLALNATIEAARAGEAGKGFAVVAGEVKELAGRTSQATDQIAKMIQTIQSDSGTVAASISQIVDVIGEIEAKQTMIAGAVEEQSATAAEISEAVSTVAVAAQSTAEVVTEIRDVSEKILAKSQRLRDLV